jgi:hypothetical protein
MNPFRLAAVVSALIGYTASGETLELEGYMFTPDEARFVISDRDTGRRSGWLAVGQSFVGYKIDRFEAAHEHIVLIRGEETIRLPLKAPSVKNATDETGNSEGVSMFSRRSSELRRAAKDSINAGKIAEAGKLARELLALAQKNGLDNGPYGAAMHDANMVLGRIALKEGNTADAIEFLLASARDNPGSPDTKSFGPNMSLARDLLERGEREAVLQYFDLCRGFWISPTNRLNAWSAAVKAGKMPSFDANLKY